MREMREVEVTGFAKSFVHRAPGRPRMASARTRRVSLTVAGLAANDGKQYTDDACDAGMMA
ncbi:hypothetical protein BSLA_02r1419 [Burkholderia stabilis]|nr:hypothetical protein BSLA_02r1419 [Burkholderia stabilis]